LADYYLDSSAVVKRYVAEAGSAWVRRITGPTSGNTIFISAITEVEVVAALSRRLQVLGTAMAAAACAALRADVGTFFQAIGLTRQVIMRASLLAERHALRGYDAVQLAAALEVNDTFVSGGLAPITLVSVDVELNAAAQLEGISVLDAAAQL
jgi:predicted nucleic acid-binding protein